mgnify:CR=1 FL=1
MKAKEPFIDVEKVLKDKNPKLHSWLPSFLIKYIKRIVHENDINHVMANNGHLQGMDFVNALIDEFGAGKEVVILGHSAGGNLAAAFAAEHPDQVDELILLDPAIYTSGGSPDWLTWIYDIPQLNHVGPALVSSIATSGLDLLDRSYFDKGLVTEELKAKYTAPLKIIGWEKAFWNFNKAPRTTNVDKKLAQITMPTLVITGDTDEVVATADSIRLASELPNAQLVVIEDCGHLPNEEKSQEFLTAVAAFLIANQ